MSSNTEKLIAEMCLRLTALTEEIAHLRSLVAGSPIHVEGWAKPRKAAAALQTEGVQNTRHLQQLRLEGAFSESKGEIRDVGRGNTPRWEYHVSKCRSALQKHFKRLAR